MQKLRKIFITIVTVIAVFASLRGIELVERQGHTLDGFLIFIVAQTWIALMIVANKEVLGRED